MAEHHRVRRESAGLREDFGKGHRPELPIDQPDLMAIIEQRAANAEQAEGREVIFGDSASDRGMRDVDEDYAQFGTLRLWRLKR
jgi:hypothetical protein